MANATRRAQVARQFYGTNNLLYPCASTAQTFYPGELIGLNSSGYATKFDDSAALTFVGIMGESASVEVESGGSNGDTSILVELPRFITLTVASAAVTDVGRLVYGKYSDGTVQFSGSYNNLIGVCRRYLDATHILVEVFPPLGALDDDYTGSSEAFMLFDDFFDYDEDDNWNVTASDSGGVAAADGVGGQITISPSDGTVADNDETYVDSVNEAFLAAQGKTITFEARVKCNDTGDEANLIVGLSAAVAANHLQDNGGGPPASYDGIVFFKVDGGTVWQGEVSVAGTQGTDTNVGAFSDNAWQTLRFVCQFTSSTSATAEFFVDGVSGGSLTFTYTGQTEMQVVLGAKNGGSNHIQLLVDYVRVKQIR